MNIHKELLSVVDEIGIIVDENGDFLDMDSIVFISMIIRIEELFGIVFPDELMNISVANNINNLETIISSLLLDG